MTKVQAEAATESPRIGAWLVCGLVASDLIARLAAPASVWAAAHGQLDVGVALASATTVLGVARGTLGGHAYARALAASWRGLLGGARHMDPGELRARFEREGVGILADAARIEAELWAAELPRLGASAALGVAVIAVTFAWLGPAALGAGALVFGFMAAVAAFVHTRIGRANERAYGRFTEVLHGFELLVAAAAELRAHGVERPVARDVAMHVAGMARAERAVRGYGLVGSLVPLGIALLLGLGPLRNWLTSLAAQHLAEAAILGVTGIALAGSLVGSADAVVRARPYRRALRAFREAAGHAEPRPAIHRAAGPLGAHPVCFEGVDVVYPGARDATPRSVSLVWSPGHGLAVLGASGAGKSSLAHCLVGLRAPTAGRIELGGVSYAELDWSELAQRIVYVPQQPYVAAGTSVRENIALLAPAASDDEMRAALERVGLLAALSAHDARRSPLDVAAGELSGGERRRLHLARAFLGAPELVVLDEPEAGLDEASRARLQGLLTDLASRTRVFLIAHDPAVVPDSFLRLRCERGPAPGCG